MDRTTVFPRQRDLWLARFYYFTLYGGMGFLGPYLNLFYTRIGLNGAQIGWTAAAAAIVTLVAAPAWMKFSQERGKSRQVLQFSLMASALVYLWLSQQRLFFWILVASAARALIGGAMSPLSDAMALAVTGAAKAGFGSVRVWGSLGWAVLVLSSGWLIERTKIEAAFYGIAAVWMVGALLIFIIQRDYFTTPGKSRTEHDKHKTTSLLRNPALSGVGIMIILVGSLNSGVLQFEPVFLDTLGAREGLIGISSMLGSVVELPFMFIADRIGRRRGSHFLLLAGMAIFSLLRGMVFVFPSIPAILLERALGGIAFSFFSVGLVQFISDQTEPEETGKALALFTVTLASTVSIIATPLAGRLYDLVGMLPLYAAASTGYGLSWLALRLTYRKPAGGSGRIPFEAEEVE